MAIKSSKDVKSDPEAPELHGPGDRETSEGAKPLLGPKGDSEYDDSKTRMK